MPAAEVRASQSVGNHPASCEPQPSTYVATPNRTVDTTAHGNPGGIRAVPARSRRRSAEVSTAPEIVTTTPASWPGDSVSPSRTTASRTGMTA